MNRDPVVMLVTLVVLLVVGSVAAVISALRADRRRAGETGAARRTAPAPMRPGEWSLVLDSAGAKKIQVVKELRAITGLGIAETKHLTDHPSSTVLTGVDHASASAAHRALTEAGATARITQDEPAREDAPGLFAVVMDDPGRQPVRAIKEIRAITDIGLVEAKRLVDHPPSRILSEVEHATAVAARDRLAAAGAAVRITKA